MELREKIIGIVHRAIMADSDNFDAHDAADAILAIPELREALSKPKARPVERERLGHRDFRGGGSY